MGGKFDHIKLTEDEGIILRHVINQNKKKKAITLNSASSHSGFCSNKCRTLITTLARKKVIILHNPEGKAAYKYNAIANVKERDVVVSVKRKPPFTQEQKDMMKELGLSSFATPEQEQFIIENRAKMSRSELVKQTGIHRSDLIMIMIRLEEEEASRNANRKLGKFKQEVIYDEEA